MENRKEGRSSGIALVVRRVYGVNALQTVDTIYFESQVWKVQIRRNCHCTIVSDYRPLYSNRNNNRVARFIDEFTSWTVNIITKFSTVVIAGDFNLHVNREDDANAMSFLDTIEALGLEQLVKELIHRSDNILDLIIIEPSERIKVMDSVVKNIFQITSLMFVFNHIRYDVLQVKEMSFRKLKGIKPEEFCC